jgi:hypothetical protein
VKTDALRIAELQRNTAMVDAAVKLLTSPVFELIAGLLVVEQIPFKEGSDDKGNRYAPGSSLVWARSAVKTVAIVQAVAPAIPMLASASADIVGSISKAVPSVAGLLAGK